MLYIEVWPSRWAPRIQAPKVCVPPQAFTRGEMAVYESTYVDGGSYLLFPTRCFARRKKKLGLTGADPTNHSTL